MKKIAILGSTGSIGTTLIDIIRKDKNNFKIELLTANKNYKKLIKQVKFFDVRNIIITDHKSFLIVKDFFKNKNVNIYNDFNIIKKIFKNRKIDYTMSSISGFKGLKPTLDIIKFTKNIAIANKESIICGWSLIEEKLEKFNTNFIPIDSEHFSIWSLLNGKNNNNLEKIYLTASGGPFRKFSLKEFKNITLKKALKHPNWSMGKKISIDSATMMNKVFEIIEAKKIFKVKYKQLGILVHPQSYLHAIVKFNNGLIKFLAHDTNMTIPIFNSLYTQSKKKIYSKPLNINVLNNLSLKPVDKKIFPVVRIIQTLTENDSLYDTVIVSANDRLVHKFLINKIKFNEIPTKLLKILNLKQFLKYKKIKPKSIKDIQYLSKLVSLKVDALSV